MACCGCCVRPIVVVFCFCFLYGRCHIESSLMSSRSTDCRQRFGFAGPNSNSKEKEGPHIDLALLPTLSKSLKENCKMKKKVSQTLWKRERKKKIIKKGNSTESDL